MWICSVDIVVVTQLMLAARTETSGLNNVKLIAHRLNRQAPDASRRRCRDPLREFL